MPPPSAVIVGLPLPLLQLARQKPMRGIPHGTHEGHLAYSPSFPRAPTEQLRIGTFQLPMCMFHRHTLGPHLSSFAPVLPMPSLIQMPYLALQTWAPNHVPGKRSPMYNQVPKAPQGEYEQQRYSCTVKKSRANLYLPTLTIGNKATAFLPHIPMLEDVWCTPRTGTILKAALSLKSWLLCPPFLTIPRNKLREAFLHHSS
jgi:hypothetical protein